MAAFSGRRQFGFFENGQAELGSDAQFTTYNHTNEDSLSGDGCFIVDYDTYGSTMIGNERIEVNTSDYYQFSVSVKTKTNNYLGNPGSGHLGFSCYDKNDAFIDLRNCGDIGNTTLSRPASPGDSIIYFTSADGWYTGADVTNNVAYFRQILFFPATHPDYNIPWQYTRFNNRSYYRMEQTGAGDWAVYLDSNTGSQTNTYTAATLPDYGYALPTGTPVSRGVAGGTYNYALGDPNYPSTWTTYTTPPFTGENRNSSYPFRYGTKYIRFLNLLNYNYRSQTGGNSARYYIDNIMLIKLQPPVPGSGNNFTPISSTIFQTSKFKVTRRGGQDRSDFF
jgi:hypothetical protein